MRALLLSTGPRALRLSPTIRRAASSSLPESTADDAAATWTALCAEASAQLESPSFARFGMDRFLHTEVLAHESLEAGLAHVLGAKFNANDSGDSGVEYEALLMHALNADPSIGAAASADLHRFLVVDPAAAGLLGPYLFYKGFQAVQCARVANYFWREPGGDGQMVARLLQSEMADVFGVDIHPGATFGRGVTIDHATGVVIGETAVVGDRVCVRVGMGQAGWGKRGRWEEGKRGRSSSCSLVASRVRRVGRCPTVRLSSCRRQLSSGVAHPRVGGARASCSHSISHVASMLIYL